MPPPLVNVTLPNGKKLEISASMQENRDSQLARTVIIEPMTRRKDITYRHVRDAVLPILDDDVSKIEAIYRHHDFDHILCVQLKLEEPDSVAALLSSKITLKPCEGVDIETKVRMYGTKEMRIRLSFIPRGTKAEEVYDWCIKSGFGEPSKIVRCTFDGIEGEAVDVVLSPNSDVNWMDEQTKYQRHGTFCGLTCKFTYTCLDLKPYCTLCKVLGHVPSSGKCPELQERRDPNNPWGAKGVANKRSADELSPQDGARSQDPAQRKVTKVVKRKGKDPITSSTPEQVRGTADALPSQQLSFMQVEESDDELTLSEDEESSQTCLVNDESVSACSIFNMVDISQSNPLKCAECDVVLVSSGLGLIGKTIRDFPGHKVCCSEPGVPRLVCESHTDCFKHAFEHA